MRPSHHHPRRSAPRPSRLALAAVLGLGLAGGVHAQAATPVAVLPGDGTLLSVSAQAEATRVPDIARVSAGVVTQAADADAAMRANATQMDRVMKAIRDAGIAARDVQTTGVGVHPQYDYRDGSTPRITGYQATNTVQATVRDIGELGGVLDALVASGANQVHGPSFDIADDVKDAAYDEARRTALEKARGRAQMYAEALGMRVRRIASISEGGGFGPPVPMMRMAMDAAESAPSTPIAPGESTLTVNLDVVFELGR